MLVVGLSGAGLLGAPQAALASGAPGAPTEVTATVTGGASRLVTVTWTAPESTGGAPVHYDVFENGVKLQGYPSRSTTVTWSAGNTDPTQPVTFTVAAANTYGTSATATSNTVTIPAAAPGAPSGVVATPGDGSVSAAWSPPRYTGGEPIMGYTVTLGRGAGTCSTTATTCTITGLRNGTLDSLTVTATNSRGPGQPSDRVEFTVGAPSSPGAPNAVVKGTVATVSFAPASAPSGYPVTDYEVFVNQNGGTWGTSCVTSSPVVGATPPTFQCSFGLPDQTLYYAVVQARNANGRGAFSSSAWFIVDSKPPVVAWVGASRMTPVYGSPPPASYGGPQPVFEWTRTGANPAAYVDVLRRDATYSGTFVALPPTSTTGAVPFSFVPGHTQCAQVRGVDMFGLAGAYTPSTCVVAPVDDRALAAYGYYRRLGGWSFYQHTVTTLTGTGSRLVLPGVRAGSAIRLLGWNCTTCAPIRVYYGTVLVRTLWPTQIPTGRPFSIALPTPRTNTTVTIRPGSAGRIRVDGLSVARLG